MLASTNFVWSKPYQSSKRDRAVDRECSEYSEPVDIENSPIYDTIKDNIVDKPPVPRCPRVPFKDRTNCTNLNVKEMSKKRSKSLSGLSNKKMLSNTELGNG